MTCRECGFPQDHPRHDLSRVGHWMLAHPFVSEDVPAAHAPADVRLIPMPNADMHECPQCADPCVGEPTDFCSPECATAFFEQYFATLRENQKAQGRLVAAHDRVSELEKRREADHAEFSKREKAYQAEIASLLGRLAEALEV